MSDGNGEFRRIYPPQESIVFDGGMDNKFQPALIPDNESPDCANVIFTDGAVGTRDGAVKLNTAPIATAVNDGLYTRRANDGSETMIAFAAGHMFTLAATTFITVPSAQSVFTAGNRVCADTAENYLFIGNGGVTPHKWDGTLFTQHGVPAPASAPTVASAGTVGALAASTDYQYKITFFNSALVESDVGPASTTFTISSTSGQNSLTGIPVAATSAGVSKRRVYRNSKAFPSTFQKVSDILDNTTTTYTDNVADSALGANAPTDNGVPPNYSAIIYHANRLFVNDPANPNYVRYSALNAPHTFPALNFFRVGDKTSDLVRGFGVYNNALYVFCDKSIWINFMPDPATDTTWRQIRSLSPFGSNSPFSILTIGVDQENSLLFPAVQNTKFVGFAAARGDTLDPSSTLLTVTTAGSDLQSARIEPDMFNVQESYLGNITGIVFKNKAYISLTYASGNTANNRIYVYDFSPSNLQKRQKTSWVPWTGITATQFCVYGGKLYCADSGTTGFVYNVVDTGVYSDNGAAIDSYYWTKEFPGFKDEINYEKDFRYANILVDQAGSYFMNLTYRADSDLGGGDSQAISLNPGSSLWGSMMLGRDTWGGGSAQDEKRVYLGALRGKRIQFKFSNQNTIGQRFKVHRMNFAYNLKGYR